MLPDTTSTLPDATSRMLRITENLTHEPIMSTDGPQQETTTGSTTPEQLSCFDVNSHCTLPDGNRSMCSDEVSAKMICAKTCGYCGTNRKRSMLQYTTNRSEDRTNNIKVAVRNYSI
ncbi:hypothetical protein CHS0354_004003 [Potamilus streckersoni]|uniref:ShKT domain-containing protein n=1 Tax=Potamilus streckersoni TaxID=2493646 RepID=A0AAE0S0V7_9BIVA|nr:hypothetical protein CHS0354_004003 [Potamilus streckersoni]